MQWDDKIIVIFAVVILAVLALAILPPEMSSKTVDNIVAGLFGLATGIAIGRATT